MKFLKNVFVLISKKLCILQKNNIMKNNHILITLFFGIVLVIIGAYLKIMHTNLFNINGQSFLSIGLLVELIAVISLLIKLSKNKKVKQILNS